MVDEIKRAIEVAEYIPFTYLIQHMGVSGEEFDERKLDAAFSSLEELMLFARQRGVEILLENIPNAISSGERLMHFLGITHLDLGFVFDTGHAHMGPGIEREFDIMKERIRSTHVHDNDGENDVHLFPFLENSAGTTDWKKTMALLQSRPGQYPLVLELREVAEMANPLDQVNRVFDELESQ
jgi:sugar phosphate isomerase/epimerase